MEQEVYTVSNEQMSAVFDFASGRFIEGRVAGEKWRNFFSNSLLSQKCVLHDFIYSGRTCKIRVKHSSEGKQNCQAKSTLTIKRSDLDTNREKFKFSNKSTKQPCTCKQVLDDEANEPAPGIDYNVCRVCLVSENQSNLSSLLIGGFERAEIFSQITGISIAIDDDAKVCSEHSAVLDLLISFRHKSRYTNETYFNPGQTEFVAASHGPSQTLQIKTEFKAEEEGFDDAAGQDLDDSEIPDSGDDAGFSQYNSLVCGPTSRPANKTSHRCESCQKFLSSERSLRRHHENIHIHKRKTPVIFQCDICPRTTREKADMRKHMQRHLRPNNMIMQRLCTQPLPFTCCIDNCGKRFKSGPELKKHEVSHSDVRLFACWCGKAFKRKSNLTGHQQTHGKFKTGGKYHCDICSRFFHTKSALEKDIHCHVRAGQATEDKLTKAGGLTKPFKSTRRLERDRN